VYRAELEQFVKKLAKNSGKSLSKTRMKLEYLIHLINRIFGWWMVNGFAPARFLLTSSTKKIGYDSAVLVATVVNKQLEQFTSSGLKLETRRARVISQKLANSKPLVAIWIVNVLMFRFVSKQTRFRVFGKDIWN
jgi:hypothetical protein